MHSLEQSGGAFLLENLTEDEMEAIMPKSISDQIIEMMNARFDRFESKQDAYGDELIKLKYEVKDIKNEVKGIKNQPRVSDWKALAKNIGVAIGTAAFIIAAAISAFKGFAG